MRARRSPARRMQRVVRPDCHSRYRRHFQYPGLRCLVHDSENEDAILLESVDHAEREVEDNPPPVFSPELCTNLRMIGDALSGLLHRVDEAKPEAFTFAFIHTGSVDHLGRGGAVEVNDSRQEPLVRA